jgi:poly-gamma-glutamate capsule biosynthesis protein CapA/YwtB (metallophosphatase superfamily)
MPTPSVRIRILVASDWAPIRAFDDPVRTDPEGVYGDLLPALRAADLRIVNCECALTRANRPVWKSGAVFKGTPGHVAGLTAVPFDAACLANNHVLDYGVAGLRDTLGVLGRHGVRSVGAGLTEEQAYRPLTMTVKGTAVHVVNISEGEDLAASHGGAGVFGWDVPRAAALVGGSKKRGGIVLAIAHCGLEYIPYPPPYVAGAFRALIDAGADAVIGHHPHVPQGIEWYHGRPIAYSLGNFLFYQLTDLYYRKVGFAVVLTFDGARLSALDVLPYRITETGLRGLDQRERRDFWPMLERLSKPLHEPNGVERAWQAYLAYYGMAGFSNEVSGILEKMKTEPPKGAAMFRNRISTMQHVELWRDFLTRVMAGGKNPHSRAARRVVERYFARK